jgi:predicted RNA-binding protein Jag
VRIMTDGEEPPPVDGHLPPSKPPKKIVRIYPYAVSRNRLERAIRELRVPADIANTLSEADVLLTLKSHEKRQPKRLREAGGRGVPMHVIKSNTVSQIESVLRGIFGVNDRHNPDEVALREVEEAISEVMASAQPVELAPQNSYVRRLQHELIQRYGLASESKGADPYRRVVIYPQ